MIRPLQASRSSSVCWILGLAILSATSWGRWLATGSVKIDDNYPSEAAGTLLLLALVTGWGLLLFGWVGLLRLPLQRPRRLIYAGLFTTAFMLPLLSNDVYLLFADAALAAHGKGIYLSGQFRPSTVWYTFIREGWRDTPCIYGPLGVLASLPSVLGGGNPWLARLFLRLAWFIPLILVMELSFRRFRNRPFFHAMLWMNPLFMVEGPGQLHLDLLGTVAITAGILWLGLGRGPRFASALAFAVASLCKISFVLTGIWFALAGAPSQLGRLRNALLLIAALLVVGAAAYLPLWEGSDTPIASVRSLGFIEPGGSSVDVIGEFASIGAGLFSNAGVATAERQDHQRAARKLAWTVATVLMQLLTLAACIPIARFVLQKPDDEGRVALATGAFIVAAVTLASPHFQSWYLMMALPFFGLSCPPAWRRWWVWAIGLSVTQGFATVLPREAALFAPVVAVGTGFTSIVFLSSFKRRFWDLAAPQELQVDQVVARPALATAA